MSLDERARAWRAELRRRAVLEGGARLAALWLGLLALTAGADRLWLLPQGLRLALWGCGAGLAAATAWRWLWRPWGAADVTAALAAASRRHPHLKDYLRPAWELSARVQAHTSAALAEAHVRRTEELLAELPRAPLDPRPPRWRNWAAAAAALAALSWARAGLPRVLMPWRDVPLERYVDISPGTKAVDWGRPAEIRARFLQKPGPREAAQLKLWVRSGGSWRVAPWSSVTDEAASLATAALSEPLRYRLTWRDLASREYALTPAEAPQLDSPRVKVEGREEEALSAAEPVRALRGAWVQVSGRPNQPLARASLRVSYLPTPVPFKLRSDGAWEAGFFAHDSGTFRFDLLSEDGRPDPEPVSYALEAKANEAPSAELLSPSMPLQASPEDVLPVAWAARDDSGVARVTLVFGDKELLMARPGKADAVGEYAWDLGGLAPGSRVEFRVKAVDDDRTPLAGFSAPGSLEIVDFRSKHQSTAEKVDAAREALSELASRHEDLAKTPDAARQSALPGKWKEALARLEDLARAMSADPYSNPGLREQAAALSEELAHAAQKGDFTAHEKLAKQLRKAERLLGEGKSLQTLQDFRHQAARMEQGAAELKAALQGGDDRKLSAALSKLQRQMEELRKAIDALPKPPASSAEAEQRQTYSVPLLQAQTTADALQAALRAGDKELAAKLAEELAQQLSRIQQAVSQASAQAAAGASSAPRPSQRMREAGSLLNEVVEEQRRLLEGSQRVEEQRRGRTLERQKKLLQELAAEQRVVASSASAAGLPPDAQAVMRSVLAEFESGKAAKAPGLLRGLLPRLSGWFAEREAAILKKLEEAPTGSEPVPGDPESQALGQRQGKLRQRTGELKRKLEELESEVVTLPPGTSEKLDEAAAEQAAAQEALGRGDTSSAAERQKKALSLLEQGGEQMGQGAQRQQGIESGMSRPGGRSQGRGGVTGADTTDVPLPSAQDYRPPRELREELERSQREARPEGFEPAIKEYFRRLAE